MSGYYYLKEELVMKEKNKKAAKEVVVPTVTETPVAVETPTLPDQIALTTEDGDRVRNAEQATLQVKIQLANLELQLADLRAQKDAVIKTVASKNQEMVDLVRSIAVANGIDPDGKQDDSRWNLNTNDMVFTRVK